MGRLPSVISVALLLIFISTGFAAVSEVYHKHGERAHSHVLPSQGLYHQHNGTKPIQPTSQNPPPIMHVHGHIFHEHPLPKESYMHKHGSSLLGRRLITLESFPYTDTPYIEEGSIDICLTSMNKKDGLSAKFNPHTDWSGLCNKLKNTKLFRNKAYEKFGKGAISEYANFERDFIRLLSMNVGDYKKTRGTKGAYSSSDDQCHSAFDMVSYLNSNREALFGSVGGGYPSGYTRCR